MSYTNEHRWQMLSILDAQVAASEGREVRLTRTNIPKIGAPLRLSDGDLIGLVKDLIDEGYLKVFGNNSIY